MSLIVLHFTFSNEEGFTVISNTVVCSKMNRTSCYSPKT